MFYVYIIKSLKDGNCYTGYTSDLQKRLAEHNSGQNKSTKHRRPFKLCYYEAYSSEQDAVHREKNLKLRAKAYTQLRRRIKDSLNT